MKDPLQPKRCARLLAALAAPERLRIVDLLREGPRTVSDLAQLLKEPIVNVSHHLTVLRHAKIVRSERKGRFMVYSLTPAVFQPEEDAAGPGHLNLGCCRIEIPKP
jgi:DNA-binding transcriptional ArsR family regulator